MAKYRIEQEREKCISCGACAAECGKFFEMGEDNKSTVKTKEFDDDDRECVQNAADNCPVSIIHIINTETDEKIC